MNNVKIVICILILIAAKSNAQNPIITHIFTADPTARVFNGKLYVYPSSDTIPPVGREKEFPRFCMPGYHVFSLENGNTWKDHGRILNSYQVPWGKKGSYTMWAPDCVEKNGKYYYYFPAEPHDRKWHKIGVGVSDSPTGPFRWEKKPIEGLDGIDPGVLIDDDGETYMYWAEGKVAKLSDDMKSLKTQPKHIEGLPVGYKEAMFPFKRKGIYYLTFAHGFHHEGYTIGYAKSENPFGPFRYMGKIMDNIGKGTNHHSIVKYQNQWILFYHNWAISGTNKLRSICADYLTFNDEAPSYNRDSKGSINKVIPTLRGIGTPRIKDTIQIDRYNEMHNCKTQFVGGNEPIGWMVCDAKNNGWVRFNRVDFTKAKTVEARVACGQRFGTFEIRLDTFDGVKIAEFENKYTGGWNKWRTLKTDLTRKIVGVHDIFITFKTQDGNTKGANINWLLLSD